MKNRSYLLITNFAVENIMEIERKVLAILEAEKINHKLNISSPIDRIEIDILDSLFVGRAFDVHAKIESMVHNETPDGHQCLVSFEVD